MHKYADKCLAAAVAAAFLTAGGVAAAPLTTADLDALEFKTVNGVSIRGSGDIAAPGAGSYRAVEDVTLYGAKGDGTADDTKAVLAAAAAAKASGRPLYFPKGASGVYRITRAIPTDGFTRVFGEGATIIRAPGPVLSVAEREVTVEGLVLACEGPSPAIDPGEAEILRVDSVAAPGRGGLLPAVRKGAVWIDGVLSVAEK